MIWMDVDTALAGVPVNVAPLVASSDFITVDEGVTYDEAGMDLVWNFTTTAGVTTATSVTPTTGGAHDWTHTDLGMYTLEIPASAGTINNDTEGFGYFTGNTTANLPFRGPTIGFRAAALNNAMIDGGDTLDVNVTAIANDAITAASINTGAFSADAFAADALIAGTFATGAFTADAFAADALVAATFAASSLDGKGDWNIGKTGYTLTNFTDANATNLNSACTNYSVTRGLTGTALPAVQADGVGGLPLTYSGALDLDAILADTNDLQTNQGDWATATSVTVSDKTGFILAATGLDTCEIDGVVASSFLAAMGAVTFGTTLIGATSVFYARDGLTTLATITHNTTGTRSGSVIAGD